MKSNLEYLSKEKTNLLKGIFAIFVVIHHVRACMVTLNNTYLGMILTASGYLSVAMFYFFSGYGLERQYQINFKKYVDSFFKNRIVSFYILYLFVLSIYLSIYLYDRNFINVILSKKLLLKSLFFGGTIIPYGWYLQSILVIYILYYLVYKYFFKSRIIFMGIALIIYSFIAFYVTKEIIYFQSVFTFELGIFWAIYKEKIDKILQNKKYYFLFLIITFLFFSISLLIGNLNLFNSTIISVINKIMSTIFFVILVLLLEMKIKLKNKVTTYLGKLFFEIYIVQWGGITIWHSKKLYIENDYIYLCITIVTTIILAIIVHPIISFINKKIKKY